MSTNISSSDQKEELSLFLMIEEGAWVIIYKRLDQLQRAL